MNDLQIINISGVDCYEKDGTAYLKLETVARGLGFTDEHNGTEYVRWARVDKYLTELGFATCGERPDYIPENVFYRLAMKAKNEAAEAFQAKIADEVIPSIRKHGAYMTPDTLDRMISSPEFGIRLLTELKEEREKRVALEGKVEADRPKVLFADAVATARNSILVGELAKIIKQNGVDIGQNRLFDWLRRKGYLISRRGSDYNMPTQRSMELGLFEIKETVINNPDGSVRTNKTPKVTGKGQQYFVERFLGGATV